MIPTETKPVPWYNDEELFALMRAKLFPAVGGDVLLDKLGFHQKSLSQEIKHSSSQLCRRKLHEMF